VFDFGARATVLGVGILLWRAVLTGALLVAVVRVLIWLIAAIAGGVDRLWHRAVETRRRRRGEVLDQEHLFPPGSVEPRVFNVWIEIH
jgi:hypothetical protein